MKVVLFCGGQGYRMRDYSTDIPKPMVRVGYRPILWHVMKYYAHFGHREFILCLGYKADVIKEYFINYQEYLSNDFVLSGGGRDIELLGTDAQDWRITFVDTGMTSNIGQRLCAAQQFLGDDEMFLANYSDNVTGFHLPDLINEFEATPEAVASFLSVHPTHSFHVVKNREDHKVESIEPMTSSGLRINGGLFALRQEIFEYIRDGEELVEQPFQRLIGEGRLMTYPYDGFWAAMDTFKDRQLLEDLYNRGNPPWEVWSQSENRPDSRKEGE
jgi:glucose-1-phosphate cytidylyltransferase